MQIYNNSETIFFLSFFQLIQVLLTIYIISSNMDMTSAKFDAFLIDLKIYFEREKTAKFIVEKIAVKYGLDLRNLSDNKKLEFS